MNIRKVLFVVGSPKARESLSQTLADFLTLKLADFGVETDMLWVTSPIRSEERTKRFNWMVDNASAVVLVFPLYADQLPSGMVKFLEDYSLHRQNHPGTLTQALMTVVHNGFPEARQNDHAVAVTRRFAELEGFRWLGGLTIGGGGLVQPGSDLDKDQHRTLRVRTALEAAAICLAGVWKEPLPGLVLEEIRKPFIPAWLYRFFGNWRFRAAARENGVRFQMNARPYAVRKS